MKTQWLRGRGPGSVPPSSSQVAPALRVPGGGTESMCETTLDNGVRVLAEPIPGVRSIAVGVWVRQGGAHEEREQAGASHLLEHMVFKGTERRSAAEIAGALERLGGSLDAYTSREHTSYQARALDEHLPESLDVLADLVSSPLLTDADLELERQVVLEELAQVEDTPDDLVFELHSERMWKGHPYGNSILGTKESVAAMPAERLRALHSERYVGENLIVAAAGRVEHEELVERVDRLLGHVERGIRSVHVTKPENARTGVERVGRDSAQTHLVFGTPTPGHAHPDRYALALVSTALGSGMSSRLFQKVREEMGLCYAVFTYQSFYRQAGVSGVYVGTRPATSDRAADAVRDELANLVEHGLGESELEQVKQQMKGQVMLSLESTGARLSRLASFALHEEPFLGLDELMARIDAVSLEDARRVADEYCDPDRYLQLRLGPLSD